MAIIDMPGFIADLKDHATRHGFHIHDERHFVESYSMRQAWEVDLHPEEACGGPLAIGGVKPQRPSAASRNQSLAWFDIRGAKQALISRNGT